MDVKELREQQLLALLDGDINRVSDLGAMIEECQKPS